jgi:hypothetical protein
MKKFSTYLASALLMLVVFTSCSSSPEDINVADLEGPCEFVDAMGDCADALLGIVEGVDSPDQLSESDRNRGQALAKKLEELGETAAKKFDEEPDCPNMEEFMVKMMKVEEYL